VRMRLIVRYSAYQRFGAETKIQYGDEKKP
jgi:hypothetical protein